MTRLSEISRDGLVFDVADSGPADGDVVILLHGFPETKESWDGVTPALTVAGYRVLAPDQRGYSPRARPAGRRAYRLPELALDIVALLDAAGAERAHVVGHDWGGAVAWALGAEHADRVETLTSLATPHPRAIVQSLVRSTQLLHSSYMVAFQTPVLPELAMGGRLFRRTLLRSGLPIDRLDFYLGKLADRDARRGALNWYRAVPFSGRLGPVAVPTMYVYATGDFALGRKAADLTRNWVSGPYRYEILDGVSHWIPEEVPDTVARLLLEHFGTASRSR